MDLITWVGAAVGCALVVLLAVVMLGRRVDQLGEQLMDLRQLQKYTQQIEQDQARAVAALGAVAEALPDLRSLKGQLEEIKRQHAELTARMEAVTRGFVELRTTAGSLEDVKRQHAELAVRVEAVVRSLGELRATAGSLDEVRRGQAESMKVLGHMANVIQRWCLGLNIAAAELERSAGSAAPVVSIESSAPGLRQAGERSSRS